MRSLVVRMAGDPVPWARVRTGPGFDGQQKFFTPSKQRNYMAMLQIEAKRKLAGRLPFDGAVRLDLAVVFAIPRSWPQWKQQMAAQNLVHHTAKPDRDNLEKIIKDAFNKVVWRDDQFVSQGEVVKMYGALPMIEARVTALDGVTTQTTRRPHKALAVADAAVQTKLEM